MGMDEKKFIEVMEMLYIGALRALKTKERRSRLRVIHGGRVDDATKPARNIITLLRYVKGGRP